MLRKLKRFLRRCFRSQAPPLDDHLHPRNAHQNSPAPSGTRAPPGSETADPLLQEYFDSAQKLKRNFPQTCSWLEPGDLDPVYEGVVAGGRYADVRRGRLGGRDVAVKSYRCYVCFDCDWVRMRFYREAHAYSLLSHRNILPLVGVYSTPKDPFCLVFDSLVAHPNPIEYLRAKPESSKVQLVAGIARGLHHMHALGVVHGNLEGPNVVVESDGTPRIGGLGSAFVQSSSPPAWSEDPPEQTRYSAPELVNPGAFGLQRAQITESSDVYAFGTLAYEVFAGNRVFPQLSDSAAIHAMSGGARPSRPHDPELSDRVWDVINRCWANTPSQRMTIADVVSVLEGELRHTHGARFPPSLLSLPER